MAMIRSPCLTSALRVLIPILGEVLLETGAEAGFLPFTL